MAAEGARVVVLMCPDCQPVVDATSRRGGEAIVRLARMCHRQTPRAEMVAAAEPPVGRKHHQQRRVSSSQAASSSKEIDEDEWDRVMRGTATLQTTAGAALPTRRCGRGKIINIEPAPCSSARLFLHYVARKAPSWR
jgi:hypothetical protein